MFRHLLPELVSPLASLLSRMLRDDRDRFIEDAVGDRRPSGWRADALVRQRRL